MEDDFWVEDNFLSDVLALDILGGDDLYLDLSDVRGASSLESVV